MFNFFLLLAKWVRRVDVWTFSFPSFHSLFFFRLRPFAITSEKVIVADKNKYTFHSFFSVVDIKNSAAAFEL